MKISAILLLALPLVALAAVLPKDVQKDAQQVAKEVQEQVDDMMRSLFKMAPVALTETQRQIEQRASSTKQQLDDLTKQPKDKFDETKKQTKNAYEQAKTKLNQDMIEIVAKLQKPQDDLDSKIQQLKEHASKTYADLKDKVNKALDQVHQDLQNMFKIPQTLMAQAQKQIQDQLNLADLKYEYALLKNPQPEKFAEAVKLLEDGLDQVVEIVKKQVDQVRQVWEDKKTVEKIDEEIKRIITN